MSINLEVCLILLRYCAQIFLYSCQIFKKFYIEKTTRNLQFVCWVICNIQTSVVMKIFGGEANLHASVYGSLISKFILYLMSRIQEILGGVRNIPCTAIPPENCTALTPYRVRPFEFAPTLCRVCPHLMLCSPPHFSSATPSS